MEIQKINFATVACHLSYGCRVNRNIQRISKLKFIEVINLVGYFFSYSLGIIVAGQQYEKERKEQAQFSF